MGVPLTFTIEHQLGKAEAKRRIAAQFASLVDKAPGFTFSEGSARWDGDVFPLTGHGYGQVVNGRIEAFETAVRVTVDVPSFLAPLAKAATSLMKSRTRLLLK